jgi:hypothetical protein
LRIAVRTSETGVTRRPRSRLFHRTRLASPMHAPSRFTDAKSHSIVQAAACGYLRLFARVVLGELRGAFGTAPRMVHARALRPGVIAFLPEDRALLARRSPRRRGRHWLHAAWAHGWTARDATRSCGSVGGCPGVICGGGGRVAACHAEERGCDRDHCSAGNAHARISEQGRRLEKRRTSLGQTLSRGHPGRARRRSSVCGGVLLPAGGASALRQRTRSSPAGCSRRARTDRCAF